MHFSLLGSFAASPDLTEPGGRVKLCIHSGLGLFLGVAQSEAQTEKETQPFHFLRTKTSHVSFLSELDAFQTVAQQSGPGALAHDYSPAGMSVKMTETQFPSRM